MQVFFGRSGGFTLVFLTCGLNKHVDFRNEKKKKEKGKKEAYLQGFSARVIVGVLKQSENEEKGIFFRMMMRMREISPCAAWAMVRK